MSRKRGSRRSGIRLATSAEDGTAAAGTLPLAPTCPDYLTGEARAEWNRIVAVLLEQRTLSSADSPALELYCRTYAVWRRAQDGVDKALVIPQGESLSANPYVGIEATMVTKLTALLSKLGLTHIRRGRPERGVPLVAEETPAAADPFAGWELVG